MTTEIEAVQHATEIMERPDDYVAPFPSKRNELAPGEISASAQAVAASMVGNAQASAMATGAMAMVELQMKMAMSYPRDMQDVVINLADSCRNPEFAEAAIYSYKQGGSIIKGPSIKMAEEIARHWGNLNTGSYVIMDDADDRTIRCWAWDLQKNVRKEVDISFQKIIQRKRNGQTEWVKPDERQLQQLTNAHASKGIRNMILSMIPNQLQRDAMSWCRQTLDQADREDPEAFKKKMLIKFDRLGIRPDQLKSFLGKEVRDLRKPADDELISYMRGVYNRIDRGDATFHEILAERAVELGIEGPPPQSATELAQRVAAKAAAAEPVRKKKGD